MTIATSRFEWGWRIHFQVYSCSWRILMPCVSMAVGFSWIKWSEMERPRIGEWGRALKWKRWLFYNLILEWYPIPSAIFYSLEASSEASLHAWGGDWSAISWKGECQSHGTLLLGTELCAPQSHILKLCPPIWLYLEVGFFQEVIKSKWSHRGGTLIL